MRSILDDDVIDPCRINRACPRELANVILKALEKERDARYPSVREFAADLRSFLRGDAVLAQSPTASQKIKRALRRRRKSLIASAITACVLAVGTLGVVAMRDSDERNSGQKALSASIEALERGAETEAFSRFLEARKQLGDEKVKQPWLDALARRAERLIAEGDEERVRRLVDACAAPYKQDPSVLAWMDRARGLGSLGFVLDPPDAQLVLRRLSKHGEEEIHDAGPEPQELPIGRYLAEASAGEEHEAARVIIDLRRGERLVVPLRALPKALLKTDCAYVAGDLRSGVPAFLIDRREVSVAQFAKFLDSLTEGVRAALTPTVDWNGDVPYADRRDKPVRGVSVAAAAAYARWCGGHLPQADEFALAGHLGAAWPFPWGEALDAARVVADPLRETGPQPPGSRPDGASRNGCVDLCGNVAEWVCDSFGQHWAAGGSYESEPRELGLNALAKRDPLEGHRDVGFRVAYYLPGPASANSVARGNWEKLRDSGRLQLRSTFAIDKRPRFEVELRGDVIGMQSLPKHLAIPGGRATFATIDEKIRSEIPGFTLSRTRAWTREYAADFPRLVRENEGRFAARVDCDVIPRLALTSLGSGRFVHRFVVVDRPGEARFHRTRLPARARVLSSTVPFASIQTSVANTTVSHEFLPRASGGVRRIPVELRFVLDGEGKPLPSVLELESWLKRFLRAWNSGQADTLRPFLADSFALGPRATRRAEVLTLLRKRISALQHSMHGATARSAWKKLPQGDLVVESIGGIAGLVSARVRLSSSDRISGSTRRWDFTWQPGDRGLELVDLRAPASVDASTLEAKRAVHQGLGIRVAGHEAFSLQRICGYPADLQLRLVKTRPTIVGRSREGKTGHEVSFAVEVFARKLADDESAEDFARSILEPAYILWTAVPFTKREQRVSGVAALRRRYFLTREWAGAPTITQERVLLERGRTGILIVATAKSEAKDANVVAIAWQQLLGKLFDQVLEGVRF